MRKLCGQKNMRKLNTLINKYGMKRKDEDTLCEDDWNTYCEAEIFKNNDVRPEKMRDPVIVNVGDEEIELNENELSVLRLGPKFCELVALDEEAFEGEVEQAILKFKWETMEDDKSKNETAQVEKSEIARRVLFEELYTKEELENLEDEAEDEMKMRDAELRTIFDLKTRVLDMRKRRTTDIQGNSRVILPKKMKNFEEEAKLEMLRQELRGTLNKYMREKCGQRGLQKSNLSRGEILGLRSLRKRVKEGEIVILPTDKSGLFAVTSRSTYIECGKSHTQGNTSVGWEDLKVAQRKLNGHTSMMIKVFGIGKSWKHTDRVKETMLGEAMATCPLSLLYKDHKGWTRDSGKLPPTRPVAGGHLGMNLYLSEVISDLVEPLVDTCIGGREVISTEDLLARLVELNKTNLGWSKWSWWEGKTCREYISCGNCVGNRGVQFEEGNPELCECNEEEILDQGGKIKVTAWWLKCLRRTDWEKRMKWDFRDGERIITSEEALPEDLQDYQVPMIILGSDVVSLYPNLDIREVGLRVKEAVLNSTVKWEGVDYMEAVRYIALNWTEDQCRSSNLRRVLPWRRKKQGSRPGIRGAGPRGPETGDTDQWIFPKVVLSQEDKLEIIGTVLQIATTALFENHYYSFGGGAFRQREGGPIGLRATCAIARLCMQLFDGKWEHILKQMGIWAWLIVRYMDDGRTLMPPLKPGWRWEEGKLKFKLKWEKEDQELSGSEITRRGILGSLGGVEDFLSFTMEIGEDFEDSWLPTLDTKLKANGSNQVLFTFYEKPSSSNPTVQRRTAMGEDKDTSGLK